MQKAVSRPVILGTDWWTDCDDVMAVRVLCNLHHQGVVILQGIAISGCMEYSVASLAGFLNHSGISVPLGIDRNATDFGGSPPYQKRLAELPSHCHSNADAMDGVQLYRKLLAESDDLVTLLEIGYPQILSGLLSSPADDISPLTGMELVKNKVEHLWIMAGKWDENPGRENNFARNARSAAAGAKLCNQWPTPITFLGFEVGESVISGGSHVLAPDDPLLQAMRDHGSGEGRCSWDPMLILLAAVNDPEAAGYHAIRGRAAVNPTTGLNTFRESADGQHRYVVKIHPDDFYRDAVNRMLYWERVLAEKKSI